MILKYFVIAITLIYLIFYAYIKIKYPFWNNQPVFHTYDFWRYFYQESFIIYKYRPIKTKFCDFINIQTLPYSECSQDTKEKIVYLLKSNYIQNDRILLTLLTNDLDALYSGHNETPYLSIYNEKVYMHPEDDTTTITVKNNPIGCILSYPITFYHQSSPEHKIYTETPIYFLDFLCVHREHSPIKKTRELFQTHEYNQRIKNPMIVGSLIKREIELFDGVVPLVQYNSYVYYLRNIIFPALPPHFQVLQIDTETIDILTDFIFTQTHLDLEHNDKYYHFISVPNMGNYISTIKSNICHVYCLKNGEDIYAMYFFKDAKMQYEDLNGNTLHFYGSFMNTNNRDLFYVGFMHAIRQILKKYPEYKMLIFENLGDNTIIHTIWRSRNTPTFVNKAAYYTFNWIFPSSPLQPENCVFL